MSSKVSLGLDAINDLESHQIIEIPRHVGALSVAADYGRDQRLAAVMSAFHSTGSVLVAWRRSDAHGPIEAFVGGSGLIDKSAHGETGTLMSLPVGGRGRPMPAGRTAKLLAELPHWARISVATDVLLTQNAPETDSETRARPALEDCLLGVWHRPFGWFVYAEPVSPDDLDELVTGIGDLQRQAKARAGSSPDYAVQAQRLEHRHRELSAARVSGLWRIHLMAGGETAAAAARIAGLICASADLEGLPYGLVPGPAAGSLRAALSASPNPGSAEASTDAPVSSALLARIARPPATEIPGVRFRLRADFDVTPENPATEDGASSGIPVGKVLDRNHTPAGPMTLSHRSLNRHTFVCGATGAGKSQTIRGLLESSTAAGLPWLVIEPAKAEYRLMASRLTTGGSVVVIRPGDVDVAPAGLNPLEPAVAPDGRRFPLQTHLDLVRSLFVAAFEATEPFPQVLSAALTRCYEELGWDLVLSEPAAKGVQPRYPSLADVQAAAERIVDEIGYGKEIADNVRGFISVRLSSLRLGTTGRFFEGGHHIDVEELLSRNVVFEIEDVGDDRDKAFLMGTVLIRLVEHLRLRQRDSHGSDSPLRHISVFEEAHRLLRRTEDDGPAAHAVEMFAGLLAEIRAYGEGLVIAEQIPAKLAPDVIKNTAVKIVHRLPAQDDRDAVGATMNITDDQSAYLVTLPPGEAAVFTDGMDFPVLVAMPDGTAREHPAATAPVTELITPRSATCGADCRTALCTLRQIRTAQHSLRVDSRIVVWCELAVLAHLTGWATPVPGPAFTGSLRAMDDRTRDCALSHAVDAAVASRSAVIADRVSTGPLAAHVVEAMREYVRSGVRHLAEEPSWLAKAYRWCYVWDALKGSAADTDGPHARTGEWERQYGRVIPGATSREQFDAVTGWFDADQRDPVLLRTIAYGASPTSAISTAVGVTPDHPDWTARLTEYLSEFLQCRWPLRYLTPNGGA